MKNAWTSLGPGVALIILLTVVAYMPAMRGGFVFDDNQLITDNRLVKASDGLYRFSLVADHWQYYPIVGVIALAVAAGERIGRRMGEQRRSLGTAAVVAVLMVLAVATCRRGCVYADDETLWRDNVAKNPGAWPHNNLGCALQRMGKLSDAIGHYEQALRIKPDFAEARANLQLPRQALAKLQARGAAGQR